MMLMCGKFRIEFPASCRRAQVQNALSPVGWDSQPPKHHLTNEKSAQRDANTARALAVVRFGNRPPAVTNPQTEPITIHCAAAS